MKQLVVTTEDTVQFSRAARKLHFFGSMNMVLLERILEGIKVFEFDTGEKVCVQGAPGDCFFVVHKGKLSVSVKKGRFAWSKRVATLGPGDCFGEMALLRQAPRNATVACLAVSRVFALPAQHFKAVLEQNPEFSRDIRELTEARQIELDAMDTGQ